MSTLLVISLYMVMAGRQLSLDARMHVSLANYAAFTLLLPLVNVVTLPHDLAYPLTLLALMGSTISSSIMQSSIVALLIVALTWVLYWALLRTKFAEPLLTEYALVQYETPLTPPAMSPLSSPMSPMRRPMVFPTRGGILMNERSSLLANNLNVVSPRRNGSMLGGHDDDADDEDDAFELEEELEEHAAAATVMNVLHTALKPFFSLFFSYFVCLSCFPGIISAIPSVTLGLGDWFPIVLVGGFNLGDLVGKNLPVYAMYFEVSTLHLPWLFQLSFLPFFMAALVHPFDDITTIVVVILLGITTGYVATCSIILAPSMCSEYQKEVAGMVGGLSSIIGLCAGSYNGLALEAIVQLCTGGVPE
ncbi:hypothetical protein BBI17_000679 [Phytophthora kernoviae]|uniref:Uncharacterized protein n=1 Tax=Phytophthora kernoviae TaxID=325452 RepID=A0A421FLV9_9STRA|nr:hypothetical protein JM16_001555 [Phytophthora kernoviae]KAG2528985.1 hypothetical protein JM18_001869 [Phytophthora kernoviae]RLN46827.1 hypothetical protein BBI17_000679 [Phytophthora kernoviae]